MIQIRPYEPTFSRNDWDGVAVALAEAGAEVELRRPTGGVTFKQAMWDSILQWFGEDAQVWTRTILEILVKNGWTEFRNRAPKERHETAAFLDKNGDTLFTVERPLPVDQLSRPRKPKRP